MGLYMKSYVGIEDTTLGLMDEPLEYTYLD